MTTWQSVLPASGSMAILGKRRMGKSALAYYLAELRHQDSQANAAVYGPPVELEKYLPAYFKVLVDLSEVGRRHDSTVIIDEGSMPLHARRAMEQGHIDFDEALSLCAQRNQLLILCTHHSKKLDPMVVRDLDLLAFKRPSKLQSEMERAELRRLSKAARSFFQGMPEAEQKTWSYVFWDDFDCEGRIANVLPSFWSPTISTAIGMGAGKTQYGDEARLMYSKVYSVALDVWDKVPELRDKLLEGGKLIKPYRQESNIPKDVITALGTWAEELAKDYPDFMPKLKPILDLAGVLTVSKTDDTLAIEH